MSLNAVIVALVEKDVEAMQLRAKILDRFTRKMDTLLTSYFAIVAPSLLRIYP